MIDWENGINGINGIASNAPRAEIGPQLSVIFRIGRCGACVLIRCSQHRRRGGGSGQGMDDMDEAVVDQGQRRAVQAGRSVDQRGPNRSGRLFQRDVAVEGGLQFESCNFERHRRRKRLGAPNAFVGDSLGHRVLDGGLRTDADHLQKFAHAQRKRFFVHEVLQ
jgi:hypothetical protein